MRRMFILGLLVLAACSNIPEPMPTVEPTELPTITKVPTNTPETTNTPTPTIIPTATITPTPSLTPTPQVLSPGDIPDEFKTAEGLKFDWMARNIHGELKLYLCSEYPTKKFTVLYATRNQDDICIGDQQFWDVGETWFIVFGPKRFWVTTEDEANRVHLVGDIYTFYLENTKVFYWDEAGGPEGDRIKGLSIPFLHCVLMYIDDDYSLPGDDENIIIWELSRTQRLSLGSGLVSGNTFGFSIDPNGIKAKSCDMFLELTIN